MKIDNSLCGACGECVECCPINAIEINSNGRGTYTAPVITDKCVDCGACATVCPMEAIN